MWYAINMKKPNLFQYHNYRLFLKDWFEFLKFQDATFSLKKIAENVGLSHGYFHNVLNNKSSMSIKALNQLESNLKLNKTEHSYLAHLIELTDAETLQEQQRAYEKILKFRKYKSLNSKGISGHKFLSKWYHVAIREMADLKGFSVDPKWIAKRLEYKVPSKEIKEALQFLLDNKYILKNEDGSYKAAEHEKLMDGLVFKLGLTEFYKQTYDIAIKAIYQLKPGQLMMASQSNALSKEGYEKAKQIMLKAQQEVQKIADEEQNKGNEVYHFSMVGFPFTKGVSK